MSPQYAHPFEVAVEFAQGAGHGSIVYYDPELGAFGWYSKEDLAGAGSWVKQGWIVWDVDEGPVEPGYISPSLHR